MLVQLYTTLTAAMTGDPSMLSPTGMSQHGRRGATFIEYMMLAAIAVALGLILWGALDGTLNDLVGRITNALTGN